MMYIDLNKVGTDADTKDFFNYQTGRWLQNDKKEREARTTKFSLAGLLDTLKEKCDYLEKTPEQSSLAIQSIEPYFEGKHNKLYKIQLKDLRTYILRIPYAIGLEEYRQKRLLSEVATMDFLQKKHGLKVPTPVDWSATTDNKLKTPYILMDYVAGEKLMSQWKPWSSELQEKSGVIKIIWDMQEKVLATEFNAIGSLYFKEDCPDGVVPYDETDPELQDRYRIGPSTEKRFWKGRTVDIGSQFRGPWFSFEDYLNDTANVQVAYAEDFLRQDPESELLKNALECAKRYQQLAPELFYPKEFSDEIYSRRLHLPDLSPLNVIGQEDFTKNWLIDFENAAVKPFMLHGVPWFVRNRGERIYKKEDVPDYEKLSETDKMIVDHYIRLTQNEFAYEFLVHKTNPELFQALHPSIKRREEVYERSMAVDINTGFYNDLDFAIYRLKELWDFLGVQPQRPFPVEYTPAQVEQVIDNAQKWNAEVSRNSVLETKGFISAREFDTFLGKGHLVPDGKGDYEFTKEFLDSLASAF